MNSTFLGLSLTYWAIPCLMFAVMWRVVWPSYRAVGATIWRYLLLRWGHALTWLFLAASTFVAGTGYLGGDLTAGVLGLLAVIAYFAFLYATITTNSPTNKPAPEQEQRN